MDEDWKHLLKQISKNAFAYFPGAYCMRVLPEKFLNLTGVFLPVVK